MTLRKAVIAFLAAHDQFETYAKYTIRYGALKDKDLHDDEQRAVGVLRDLVRKIKNNTSGKD